MRITFFIVCLLPNFISAQFMWQIKKDTVIKWHYFDGDEFNNSEIDKEKWLTSYSWTEVNYPLDFYMTPKQIQVENGVCKFTCIRDTGLYEVPSWQLDSTFKARYRSSLVNETKFKYFYSSGVIRSKQGYGKGYFEIRFKHDDSHGMWPAFWLYGKQKDEIDFFELKGERNEDLHVDVHCLQGCDKGYKGGGIFPKSFGGWIKTTENLKNGYNVISGEWQDGYVKWYLNGIGIAYYKGEFTTDKMHLITGTGPAKDGQPFSPGITEESYFPNSLDVDYIRIWNRKENENKEILGKQQKKFDFYKSGNDKRAGLKKKIGFMYSKKQFKQDLLTVSIMPSSGKKIIITSLGKEINYKISFYTTTGKELLSKNIISEFEEIDFLGLVEEKEIKVKIEATSALIEQTIQFN